MTEEVQVHGHCWMCGDPVFQPVIEDEECYFWYCSECQVKHVGPACECDPGVVPQAVRSA